MIQSVAVDEHFNKLAPPYCFFFPLSKVHAYVCQSACSSVVTCSTCLQLMELTSLCSSWISGIVVSILFLYLNLSPQLIRTAIYLQAITGDAVVSRCQKVKNLLEQRLGQIKTMVQPELAAEVRQIVHPFELYFFVSFFLFNSLHRQPKEKERSGSGCIYIDTRRNYYMIMLSEQFLSYIFFLPKHTIILFPGLQTC